jgi:hypothetical protein
MASGTARAIASMQDRPWGVRNDFQHTHPARDQGLGHGHGMGRVVQHDDRNDRAILHQLQGGQSLLIHVQAPLLR